MSRDECIIYGGAVNAGGYGRQRFRGKCEYTHRIAYQVAFGDIPVGMHVLHKCDTPACINPSHLFLGTQSDNAKDRHAKGRSAKGPKMRKGKAKLQERQIPYVRALLTAKVSHSAISAAYGISIPAVAMISQGRTWKEC